MIWGILIHSKGRRLKKPYLDFLQDRLLPPNSSDVMKIQRKSLRFFVDDGILFRRGFNQVPLRYIASDEVAKVLQEVHVGDCG